MSGERITLANVRERVDNLNRRLAHHGSKYQYRVEHRYDYYALDRCLRDDPDINFATLWSTVITGCTKREIADFLHAGMVVLDDVEMGRYMDEQGNYVPGSAGI